MIPDSNYEALEQLAQFASETTFADLPIDIIERAQWVLRDTVGVIIGGLSVPEVANLAQYANENYPGQAQIISTPYNARPEWTALVYGTAGTTLEFDEGHAFARGHAAIHAVATVLALASAHNLSGIDIITALVIGYEVAVRIGVATNLRQSVHPFGAWGVIGVAAIGGKLAGFNAEEMLAVFDIAASYAIAPSFKTALQGANVRNTYAGMVNHNGLLAVEMFKLGFRGESGGICTTFGEILGDSFEPTAITNDLGDRYEILRGYFKPYSACRYSHASIDAVLAVRNQINIETITQIDIETYDIASKLNEPHPLTPLAARFSIPYITATTLYDGDAQAERFTESAIQRQEILALAEKVTVRESETYTAMLPEKRCAKITFHTTDKNITAEAIGSKGDPDQPMTEQELLEKFLHLTTILSTSDQTTLWKTLGNLTELDSITFLFDFSYDKAIP